ncbi:MULTISPECIES: GntR family transcriptional regulator [Niallia]|jgi:GntR family transcriptional regulator|uniref:GntR family transcriptional regulator n=1 Tax=Niallia circulans TaxID=1397 RepID=A0A268FA40_NIACI|nr:GntR family transcriptional regulator [Niallia circulans]AYV67297.1 GntR family transcriptional regulator [Niallia circulans]NRG28466.1 GntR family transcriptional regulator [Niallia circulans]PAD82245.1 GntR family transcriptional regulator [Niallia circulans]QJX63243.1 GntR family transcriptional regulator [Niallia circulans]UQZ76639.1 GntR family transcriptional regulator [Niallia circulans]
MADEFESSRPIYMQIVEKITQQIARYERMPGDKLPSVREMAIASGVNPNTIQRTYGELERMKIVETRRGQGTFITESEDIIEELRTKLQHDLLEQFIRNMQELGIKREEMVQLLEIYLQEKKGEK